MTTHRRRLASVIAFSLACAASGCGGDGLTLPDDARPADIRIVSGDAQSAPAGASLGHALVVRVTDALSRPVEGQPVVFSIDAGGGQVAPATVATGADGQASAQWTLGAAAGQQRVQALVSGAGAPAALLVKFSASAVSGAGTQLTLVSGDNQQAAVGSALPDSLIVRVTDANGNPAPGVQVDWTTAGGGSISPATGTTDAGGEAAAERVLGSTSGTQTATATSAGLTAVEFTHTAEPANPTALVLISGSGQVGAAGAPLPDSLVVRLEDDNGNGVGGKPVTWVVATGGGTVSPTTSLTNPNGFASTEWTLGRNSGPNLLNAVFSGLPSVPISATAQAGVPVKLAFTVDPVTTTAGGSIVPAVRVAVEDAAGNTVSGATDVITLALGANPGAGTLGGNVSVAAVNGFAIFPGLSVDKTGVGYTLVATSGTLASDTSQPFDVLPGAANRLVFVSEPADRAVGQPFSPTVQVQVQDAGGNPVLTATSPITLASSVNGTLTGTAAVIPLLGTATFPNLAINRAGTAYTLTALSSGVASATSASFDVAQAATTVAITTRTPTSSVPGQNVTVGYDANVTAPGAGSLTGQVTVTDGTSSCTGGITTGAGTGSCALAFPTAGGHDLTATYSGDVNFLTSTSAPVTHTVAKANTSMAIVPETPDPSVVGNAVTVQWNLTSSGTAPLTGTVTLTVAPSGETCSDAAALGTGSCILTFATSGARTITATYTGDANYNGSSDTEGHTVGVPNTAPTAVNDPAIGDASFYTENEEGTLNVSVGKGVLGNDSDPQGSALTAVNASDPAHGTVTLAPNGSFTYVPDADFNGTDSFTYQASDGSLTSSAATVTVTVTAVNDPPTFTPGPDVSASASGPAFNAAWATNASAGPADENGQVLTYTVTVPLLAQLLFNVQPAIAPSGVLTFTPSGLQGSTTVSVVLDDGLGGESAPHDLVITIDP